VNIVAATAKRHGVIVTRCTFKEVSEGGIFPLSLAGIFEDDSVDLELVGTNPLVAHLCGPSALWCRPPVVHKLAQVLRSSVVCPREI
jgi:hypothetical protein